MSETFTDQEFLEFTVKLLVDNPEDVKVERKIDEMGVLITLDVNQKDMGMVIGREGATAKALRTILRVIGARNNARVNLKINEPAGSERATREPREVREPQKKSLDEVMGNIQI
ncbi:KH domain-containing protein [Patescibacteria group bacterium]|nr:MAG: KH domain-containing protein [Patescibacteria group bacterium]